MSPIEQFVSEYGVSITNQIIEMHYVFHIELTEEHMPILIMAGNYLRSLQNLDMVQSLNK
jgi:hypothetical protein